MSRLRIDATDIARIAVFAAIVAALGLPGAFSVLGAVPITAQTLGVMLAGAILGPWRGMLSMLVLLALVAIGLPLLSGGRGGIGVFIGGIGVIYAFGIPVQSLVTRLPLGETALQSLVFVPGDLVKVVLATVITMTLARAYPRAFRNAAGTGSTRPGEPARIG